MATDPGSWQGIEFRHLAALEAIAAAGSFSAAAVRLGYSQSAVSGQIATLERLVGARLVARIRGSRSVTLTREGERLVEHARAINARLSAAREDVAAAASAEQSIRIGTFQSVSQTLLPKVVHALTSATPRVTPSLREDPAVDHLAAMVESGELDLSFVLLPLREDVLETVEVMRDPWLLVVRTDHPLVWQQRSVSAGDLSNLPLVAFEQVPTQKVAEGALRAAGANLRVVTRLADFASVLSMVSAGLGCGLVPRLAVEAEVGTTRMRGLRFLPIADQPPRLVALAWRRDRAGDPLVERVVRLTLDSAAGEDAPPALSAHG